MKKFIKIFTVAIMTTIPFMSNLTVSAYEGTYNYVKEQYLETNAKIDVDWDLFDKYITYSLGIDDYSSLTDEKKELCKFVFDTERSKMPYVYCQNARNTILEDKPSRRVSFDDYQTIASVVDPAPSYYTYFSKKDRIIPDIVYLNLYDVYSEYWLDDEGSERIILNSGDSSEFEYIKFYDKMPDDPEITKNILSSEDGETFVYCETKYVKDYKNCYNLEYFCCDIWEYTIVPDGTAVIVGCTLPDYNEAIPLKKPTILPEELDGYTVSGIFRGINNTGITKLIVPENIKYIKSINNMPYLTEIEINSPNLELGNGSFMSCPELKNVKINVKNIVGTAFSNCPNLESVEITNSLKICADAFANLPKLSNVILPDNLETIGQCAFTGTAVEELEFPKGLKLIGSLKMPYFYIDKLIDTLTDDIVIAENDCLIKGYYNTEAHKYAVSHNMKFRALDTINFGDVNADGKINIADAVVLQKYILGNAAAGYEADINKDGIIDVFDMIFMRKQIIENK